MKIKDFRQAYRLGPYAWPGGYPIFALTSDGATLCFKCLKAERRNVLEAIRDRLGNGWQVVGFDVNWENGNLSCDHCNERIESAYAEDEVVVEGGNRNG